MTSLISISDTSFANVNYISCRYQRNLYVRTILNAGHWGQDKYLVGESRLDLIGEAEVVKSPQVGSKVEGRGLRSHYFESQQSVTSHWHLREGRSHHITCTDQPYKAAYIKEASYGKYRQGRASLHQGEFYRVIRLS